MEIVKNSVIYNITKYACSQSKCDLNMCVFRAVLKALRPLGNTKPKWNIV